MQIQFKELPSKFKEVVICFKFSNFAYANTVYGNKIKRRG